MKTNRPLSHFSPKKRITLSLIPLFVLILVSPFFPESLKATPIVVFYPMILITTWLGGSTPGTLSFIASTIYLFGFFKPQLIEELMTDRAFVVRVSMLYLSTAVLLFIVREYERALAKTEAALKLRDEFLSTISHELKTPITAIRLQLEVLKDQQKESPSMNTVTSIEKMVNRQDKLVESMLDIALIESGQIKIRKEECDLVQIINKASKQAQQSLDSSEIKIEAERLLVNCDKNRMEQVIFNLVHNAIRFGDKKSVDVTLTSDGKNAFIKISNSGTEIQEKDKRKIFQKMMRPLVPRQVQGLGLGLYLAKEFVELHDGSIEVSSAKQTGTTFTVALPLS